MNSAVRAHNVAHLANLQSECRLLKGFLHLTRAEETEVATSVMRAVVAVHAGKLGKLLRRSIDLASIALQELNRLLFRARDVLLLPAARPPATPVLDKQMAGPYLSGPVTGEILLGTWKGGDLLLGKASRRLP